MPNTAISLGKSMTCICSNEQGKKRIDLAKAILNILPKLENKTVELFHFSNEGVCSWFDFAKAIFEIKGLPIKVNPIESKLYPTPAKRPFYTVLHKPKIKVKYLLEILYCRDSLKDCISKLGEK